MRNVLAVAALCFASGAWGCAKDDIPDLAEYMPAWGPFAEKNTSGIRTPAERMEQLQGISANASQIPAAERNRMAAEAAKGLSVETDPLVRCQMVRTLGDLACPAAAQVLRQATRDAEPEVRIACCEAWGAYGGPEAVAALATMAREDENNDVRIAAVEALGETGESGAIEALAPALEHEDPAMQYSAVESLRRVSGRDFGNDVNAWREFAAGREPQTPEQGLAERLWGWWR